MLRSRHTSTASLSTRGSWQDGCWQSVPRPRARHRYCGKEKDAESCLYYYGARYYESWTCRFVSVDPLAEKYAQLSSYNYADNSPVTDLDVDGMQATNSDTSKQGGKEATYSGTAIDKSDANNWKTVQVTNVTQKETNSRNLSPSTAEVEVVASPDNMQAAPSTAFSVQESLQLDSLIEDTIRNRYIAPSLDSTKLLENKTRKEDSIAKKAKPSNESVVDIAQSQLGITEIRGSENEPEVLKYFQATSLKGSKYANVDETAWCAAFANWCLAKAGIKGTNNAKAGSFDTWGMSVKNKPVPGSIVTFDWNSDGRTDHVGIYLGTKKNGSLTVLHGNYGGGKDNPDKVTIGSHSKFIKDIRLNP